MRKIMEEKKRTNEPIQYFEFDRFSGLTMSLDDISRLLPLGEEKGRRKISG